jgi:hypothetical protein
LVEGALVNNLMRIWIFVVQNQLGIYVQAAGLSITTQAHVPAIPSTTGGFQSELSG